MIKTFDELFARMRSDNRKCGVVLLKYTKWREEEPGTEEEDKRAYSLMGYLSCLMEEDYISVEEFDALTKLLWNP